MLGAKYFVIPKIIFFPLRSIVINADSNNLLIFLRLPRSLKRKLTERGRFVRTMVSFSFDIVEGMPHLFYGICASNTGAPTLAIMDLFSYWVIPIIRWLVFFSKIIVFFFN